jgi:hypothetical protein
VQVLFEHDGVPFALLHALPHAPQLRASVARLTQNLKQHALPFEQPMPAD